MFSGKEVIYLALCVSNQLSVSNDLPRKALDLIENLHTDGGSKNLIRKVSYSAPSSTSTSTQTLEKSVVVTTLPKEHLCRTALRNKKKWAFGYMLLSPHGAVNFMIKGKANGH